MKKLNLKYKKVIAVTAVITVVISACNFAAKPKTVSPVGNSNNGQNDSVEDPKSNVEEKTDTPVDEEIPDEQEQPKNETEPEDGKIDEKKPVKTDTYINEPTKSDETKSSDVNANKGSKATAALNRSEYLTDSSLQDEWATLDAIAEAGQNYYMENFSKTRVITKNGYLYNKSSEELIDVRYLVANGYLDSKYVASSVDVLLLDCDDFSHYDKFSLKSWETGLTVFAAMKHPSSNVYLLTTSKSSGGAISASQYAALLNSYYQNHGAVGRIYSGTEEYSRILNFISMYESKYENYYVRSIIADNKYAMVVLSGQSNTADIKQYILKRSGSIWEVVLSGLESDPRVIITVNRTLPDYNITMLPAYTINDFFGSLSKDKYELTSDMISRGMISAAGDIKYIAGTNNYCYIVLKNEVKYICNYTGEKWNIVQVSSSDEAQKKMLAISKTSPTFIILDR
ncbi:MAG: hypothetical protein PHY44_04360 [Lachnospiraceae bacterium]|nr:hypothetical protein [Lachnospiraceae bacterium]